MMKTYAQIDNGKVRNIARIGDAYVAEWLAGVEGTWVEFVGDVRTGDDYDGTDFSRPVDPGSPMPPASEISVGELRSIIGTAALKKIKAASKTDDDIEFFWDMGLASGRFDRTEPFYGEAMDLLLQRNVLTQAEYDLAYPVELRQ